MLPRHYTVDLAKASSSHTITGTFRGSFFPEAEIVMVLFFLIVNASAMNAARDVPWNLSSMSTLIESIHLDRRTKSWLRSLSPAEIWYVLTSAKCRPLVLYCTRLEC